MAVLRALVASLLLSVMLFHFTTAQQMIMNLKAPAPSPVPHTTDCGGLCGGRCKESKRPNLCKRSCGSCCVRCGCVPPGTYGNYEACPCYFHLTTRNQTRKCP